MTQARYWLMKTEPDVFSIDDLARMGRDHWDGIRNYQARNFMRDDMQIGDLVLIYHSNAKPPGVAGLAEVCSEPYPDHTAWDSNSKYFDAKSSPENPRWMMVDVAYKETFSTLIPLEQLKADPALTEMLVVRKGQRLSIQPVEKQHFQHILRLANSKVSV